MHLLPGHHHDTAGAVDFGGADKAQVQVQYQYCQHEETHAET